MDKQVKKSCPSPTFLNVADALGAPNPCQANLFNILTKLILDTSTNNFPVPRHTYFVSPLWNATELPAQFYTDIQDAIDAIVVAAGGAPSASDNYQILVFPGHYGRVAGYTLASNINISGTEQGSVFINSPVVWQPGVGVNANQIALPELVEIKDVILTGGFAETVTAAKLVVVPTALTFEDVKLIGRDYTFSLRPDTVADSVNFVHVGSQANVLSFSGGGKVRIQDSKIVNTLPIVVVGDAANLVLSLYIDDTKIVNRFSASDAIIVLSNSIVSRAWTVAGKSKFTMTNTAADNNWTLVMSDTAHADIWSSPHNSQPGSDAVSVVGAATVHRDLISLKAIVPMINGGSVVVPILPMLDTNYTVSVSSDSAGRVINWSNKTTNSVTFSGFTAVIADSNIDVYITRVLAALNLE